MTAILLLGLMPTVSAFECHDAKTTIEINQCATDRLDSAEKKMLQAFQKAIDKNKADPVLVNLLHEGQQEWQTYRQSYCDSIYRYWQSGSIRNSMAIDCKINLTQARTERISVDFMVFQKTLN